MCVVEIILPPDGTYYIMFDHTSQELFFPTFQVLKIFLDMGGLALYNIENWRII